MPDMISLPQLLDLSLGTPDAGAVNFNQLHKLLLEIINRLNLSGHPVPLTDVDAKRESKGSTPGYQKSSYHALSDKVHKIERDLGHMSMALPEGKEMIAKVKTNTPLTDLWQHMQVNKRVESNEDGIKTAMTLIEQLIKDMDQLKDENKDLRSRLDKIDMDEINKQLQRLDDLSDQMKAMSELTNKLNDVDAHKAQLDDLQKKLLDMDEKLDRLDALPAAEEIVTWPGLQDALSGVKGEFAAYRPASRAQSQNEGERSATKVASAASLDTSLDGKAARPSSRPKSSLSDGPSVGLVDVLEKLGTVDKRHEDLKKRVSDLEEEMKNKANKEDINLELPDDLMDRINDMDAKLSQLDDLRAKQFELDVLLSDIPQINDYTPPPRGDKTRASVVYASLEGFQEHMQSLTSDMSPSYPTGKSISNSKIQRPSEKRSGRTVVDGERKSKQYVVDQTKPRRESVDKVLIKLSKSKNRDGADLSGKTRSKEHVMEGRGKMSNTRVSSQSNIKAGKTPNQKDDQAKVKHQNAEKLLTNISERERNIDEQPIQKVDQAKMKPQTDEKAFTKVSKSESKVSKPKENIIDSEDVQPSISGNEIRNGVISKRSNVKESVMEPGKQSSHVEVVEQAAANLGSSVMAKASEPTIVVQTVDKPILETSGGKSRNSPSRTQSSHTKLPGANINSEQSRSKEDPPNSDQLDIKQSEPLHTHSAQKPTSNVSHDVDLTLNSLSSMSLHQRSGSTMSVDTTLPHITDSAKGNSPLKKSKSEDSRSTTAKSNDSKESLNRRKKGKKVVIGDSETFKAADGSDADESLRDVSDLIAGYPLRQLPKRRHTYNQGRPDTNRSPDSPSTSRHSTQRFSISGWPDNIIDSPMKFNRTLREVLFDDYMPEIIQLKSRVFKLEEELPQLRRRSDAKRSMPLTPVFNFLPPDDDERLAELMRHFNDHYKDVNQHLADVDDTLDSFINGNGRGDEKFKDKLHVYDGKSDADSVRRLQNAMSDLRDELDNLQKLMDAISQENREKAKLIEQLTEKTDKLDKEKADKEFVEAELDAKADKSQIDGKLNRSVFDSTVGDLQKMIDDLLAKLLAYEDAWKQAHTKVEEDVDGKIDRTELERLKSYLDRKLRELNTKLKQNSGVFNPFCEDAAGLKKQLLPFNCLSCDKPVVISNGNTQLTTQSTPGPLGDAFAANKSTRPYTTFELDHIRQHAKSLLNADYVMDYYSTPRTAGGSHTMTYPHKRVTKQGYTREPFVNPADDVPPEVYLPVRDETEIVGADGHVYRGRFDINSGDPNAVPSLEGRPTTPIRPKTSPVKRPISGRPGMMARPKTAAPVKPQLQVSIGRDRPSSARERPVSSMAMRDDDEGGMADNLPAVTVETVTAVEPQANDSVAPMENTQA